MDIVWSTYRGISRKPPEVLYASAVYDTLKVTIHHIFIFAYCRYMYPGTYVIVLA